ncbi:MAG: AlpA family phage regulatory protein [Oscillospiraceae bacterium]|nr:AlpA family phage regulatory protein [Oscillospiraceae bacterium]
MKTDFSNNQTTPKLAVNTTELAEMMGISRPFCYELINRADFPKSFYVGTKRLHSVDAVREWIANQIKENP